MMALGVLPGNRYCLASRDRRVCCRARTNVWSPSSDRTILVADRFHGRCL